MLFELWMWKGDLAYPRVNETFRRQEFHYGHLVDQLVAYFKQDS